MKLRAPRWPCCSSWRLTRDHDRGDQAPKRLNENKCLLYRITCFTCPAREWNDTDNNNECAVNSPAELYKRARRARPAPIRMRRARSVGHVCALARALADRRAAERASERATSRPPARPLLIGHSQGRLITLLGAPVNTNTQCSRATPITSAIQVQHNNRTPTLKLAT